MKLIGLTDIHLNFLTLENRMEFYQKVLAASGDKILISGDIAEAPSVSEILKCNCYGCQITGDIKKNKYVYYSCTNGKGIYKKEWVREEELIGPMLNYLDRIQLPDDLIAKITDYLKKSFEAEQEFYKQTHENLRKELDQVQNQISRLVDSHLDGKINGDIYEQKLNEYKKQ